MAVIGCGLTSGAARAQTMPGAALAKLPESARRAFNQTAFEQKAATLFARLGAAGLPYQVFREGLLGYCNVRAAGKAATRPVLTLVDFSLPSQQKRLWVIDVAAGRVFEPGRLGKEQLGLLSHGAGHLRGQARLVAETARLGPRLQH